MESSGVLGRVIQVLSFLFQFYLTQINIRVTGTINRWDNQKFNFLSSLNKSESGFIPSSSKFYPSYDYTSTSPRQYPISTSAASYYEHNGPHPTQFQQYQHTPPSHGSQFQNHGEASQQHRGIIYPQLPLGYYPPHFGIGTPIKPLPPTNPYHPILDFNTLGNPSVYEHFSRPSAHFSHHPHQFPPSPVLKPQFYDGFDVGTLPKQVRVPGDIRVDLHGKDAEITCEFPKYLILIQGIFWHHKYNDPFGSYFDTQNGFGSHTTVRSVNQWKSILLIQDFNTDDFGFYRCISAAILPSDAETIPSSPPSPPSTWKNRENHDYFNHNPPKTLSTTESLPIHEFDSDKTINPIGNAAESSQASFEDNKSIRASRYTKNSRRMKFSSPQVEDTKVRFTRQASIPGSNDIDQTKPASSASIRRYYAFPDISPYPYPLVPNQSEDYSYRRLTNPYVDRLSQSHPNLQQNVRHLPHLHYHPYPEFGFGSPAPPPTTSYPFTTGFGLKVPYYQPTFAYFTIYQEIKFEPSGVAGRRSVIGSGGIFV